MSMNPILRYALAVAVGLTPIAAQAGPVDTTQFNGTTFPANDDGATAAIALPFMTNYFGTTYSSLYVSNNGYVTFNSGQGTYTPSGLGAGYSGQPIIAAFFADVDTRNPASALTAYGTGTYNGHAAFGATWNGVGYYNSAADKLNVFQLILTDRSDTGSGNFDIFFNYNQIQWETGAASGGSGGLGGTSAAVGYNAGVTGSPIGTYFELNGSRIPGSFLDGSASSLITTTNDGVLGQLAFQVRNGVVTAPPTVPGVPEPATWMMMLVGFGMCAMLIRRNRQPVFVTA